MVKENGGAEGRVTELEEVVAVVLQSSPDPGKALSFPQAQADYY